jgi:serine/threonine-protein kinase
VEVRDWTGKDADAAMAWADSHGLDATIASEDYSETVAAGDVISQSPTEGPLFRGDEVSFVVSKGPELVEIPGGLVASGVEAAQNELESLGFDVEIQHIDNYLGLGFVYSVDPGSGNSIPQGSTVTLWLI